VNLCVSVIIGMRTPRKRQRNLLMLTFLQHNAGVIMDGVGIAFIAYALVSTALDFARGEYWKHRD
jgi:hypothetical protein